MRSKELGKLFHVAGKWQGTVRFRGSAPFVFFKKNCTPQMQLGMSCLNSSAGQPT